MEARDEGALVGRERSWLYVAGAAALVAALGAGLTGRASFAVAAIASAALAFGTMAVAARKGREAIADKEPMKAGAIAGALLAARLVGLGALMVASQFVPAVFDIWGVLAGMVAADATLLVIEGAKAFTVA